jgi:hypothetical protein
MIDQQGFGARYIHYTHPYVHSPHENCKAETRRKKLTYYIVDRIVVLAQRR